MIVSVGTFVDFSSFGDHYKIISVSYFDLAFGSIFLDLHILHEIENYFWKLFKWNSFLNKGGF